MVLKLFFWLLLPDLSLQGKPTILTWGQKALDRGPQASYEPWLEVTNRIPVLEPLVVEW